MAKQTQIQNLGARNSKKSGALNALQSAQLQECLTAGMTLSARGTRASAKPLNDLPLFSRPDKDQTSLF